MACFAAPITVTTSRSSPAEGPRNAMQTSPHPELNGPAPRIRQAWTWLIGQPSTPELIGQCCDRLRPSFVRQALERALPLHTAPDALLVDWRWDGLRDQVSGLVLQGSQLHPFRWWPQRDCFQLRGATVQLVATTWPAWSASRGSARQRRRAAHGRSR